MFGIIVLGNFNQFMNLGLNSHYMLYFILIGQVLFKQCI